MSIAKRRLRNLLQPEKAGRLIRKI